MTQPLGETWVCVSGDTHGLRWQRVVKTQAGGARAGLGYWLAWPELEPANQAYGRGPDSAVAALCQRLSGR